MNPQTLNPQPAVRALEKESKQRPSGKLIRASRPMMNLCCPESANKCGAQQQPVEFTTITDVEFTATANPGLTH